MKIIVTGSLGNISKPLTRNLVEKGHTVTVISSKAEKRQAIADLGAVAAIGSLEDVDFLTETFTGADAAYCMTPPNYSAESDIIGYYKRTGDNYAAAIRQAGIQRVVYLSSFGADLDKGTGIILGSHAVEVILASLPDIRLTVMRPGYFYYNLYNFAGLIKSAGFIAANYGGEDMIPLVSPFDIADAITEEITSSQGGNTIRYVASEELSCNDIARTLGAAIGKPGLRWETISDEQMLGAMEGNGVPRSLAKGLVEMYASLHSGRMAKDYTLNRPAKMGKVKMAEFAKEFAAKF